MPCVAPVALLRAVFAASLVVVGLIWGSGAVQAASPAPAAAPPSLVDTREQERARAFVQALALGESQTIFENTKSLAQLLMSTERRFKRRRDAFFQVLDAFGALNTRCEALEEEDANARRAATGDAVEQCSQERRKSADRVVSFPELEPAYLNAMDAARTRYGSCQAQKKEAAANPAKKEPYDQCLNGISGAFHRIRDTYPNLDWMKRTW